MTSDKELIEQLAKEHGAIKTTQNVFTDRPQYVLTDEQLEAFAKAYQSQSEQQEAVAVLNSTWGSDTGWQYNIKLLPSFETDKYLESIDGHDIYLYLSPPKQSIPDGWKLVPIKATESMLQAAIPEIRKYESIQQVYEAMLNAAPTNTEVGE